MTIITLASVGYGEVHALDNSGKVWSILLIIFGVTGVGALFKTINEEIIQSQLFWKNKMNKIIDKLNKYWYTPEEEMTDNTSEEGDTSGETTDSTNVIDESLNTNN